MNSNLKISMKRSQTEKSIKSSHKRDYVKMIKNLLSPKKGEGGDARHNRSVDSGVSSGSVTKNAKEKL